MSWTIQGTTWHLAEPVSLLAAVLCILPWIRRPRGLSWPTLDGFKLAPAGRAGWIRHLPALLTSLCIACIAVALARPQALGGITRIAGKGVAIVVAIDRSSSMTAADFPSGTKQISRLDAARSTFAKFVLGRPDDFIGLLAFARIPVRISPPTLDHAFVLDASRAIRPARIDEDGTNLGYTIAFGLGELRETVTRKKVLVLLTDGRDAPASVEGIRSIVPEDAAVLSRGLGVTLHMIAVGRPAKAADPEKPEEPGPDFERLRHLAELGGGRAFVASDADELGRVFAEIDSLEKSPVAGTIRARYREGYAAFLIAAIALLCLERMLSLGPLRRVP